MDEMRSALEEYTSLMGDLVENLCTMLCSGLQPACENFIGFFHAIDWTESWLMGLMGFHVFLVLVVILTRKRVNFQMCLFLLALMPFPGSSKHGPGHFLQIVV